MSKLLDLLQRISDGSPAPLGFGAARSGSLPGMALLGRAGRPARGRRPRGLTEAAVASLDAVIVDDASSPEQLTQLAGQFSGTPWGVALNSLTEGEAQACAEGGADLLLFSLEGAEAAAVSGADTLARLLTVSSDLTDRELRAIAALPVDALVVNMKKVSGSWTLADMVKVGQISRRVEEYVLVEVAAAPGSKELEALRNMGVSGLIVEAASLKGSDLTDLKSALRAMPRSRPRRRGQLRANAPSPGLVSDHPPIREDDGDDYDDDD